MNASYRCLAEYKKSRDIALSNLRAREEDTNSCWFLEGEINPYVLGLGEISGSVSQDYAVCLSTGIAEQLYLEREDVTTTQLNFRSPMQSQRAKGRRELYRSLLLFNRRKNTFGGIELDVTREGPVIPIRFKARLFGGREYMPISFDIITKLAGITRKLERTGEATLNSGESSPQETEIWQGMGFLFNPFIPTS
jgi:hypothetical protein